ncbi:hypothetical protein Vadar_003631 [Vaccinium darrowii]|uniref:Uncharacterized protein n=1 Tax=Vaccinium darrowii TaxID=229202 RepID=A0ACB7XWV0_9ERIC|nr:hypothetical protein Vadar_003631 [Vaccinium darrowii]
MVLCLLTNQGDPYVKVHYESSIGSCFDLGCENFEQFRKLGPAEFEGTVNSNVAEGWFKSIERILDAMGVTDGQKVTLATFVLRGNALNWWEAITRH